MTRFLIAFFSFIFLAFNTLTPALAEPIKSGELVGVNGKKTRGNVVISREGDEVILTLSDDFKTSFGPSLFVYLGNGNDIGTEIAKLKKRKKGQSYVIPASVKLDQFSKVFIYCKPFSVIFGEATLK